MAAVNEEEDTEIRCEILKRLSEITLLEDKQTKMRHICQFLDEMHNGNILEPFNH